MIRIRELSWVCLAMLVTVGFVHTRTAVGSAAEELTKVLPDDTVYFIATSGGDALKDECARTILGRICHDPGVQSFITQIKNEAMARIKKQDGADQVPQIANMVLEYGRLVLSRPIVVGVAKAETAEGPPACLFGMLDAGDRKSALAAVVTRLEAMLGEDEIAEIEVGSLTLRGLKDNDVPLYWGWVGNYLVLHYF